MNALKRQFLVSFAAMGSVLAYLPVLLEQRLGSLEQVGLVMSTTGLAVILTPVIMTALADTRLQSRTLIATLFAISSVTCFWQANSYSFAGLFISHTVFAFFFWPLAALQDGLVFADNRQAAAEERAPTPYHRVRVFGTIGFALPLAGLYFLLGEGYDASAALLLGGIVCAAGAINALTLPRTGLSQARRARYEETDNAITDGCPGSSPAAQSDTDPIPAGKRPGHPAKVARASCPSKQTDNSPNARDARTTLPTLAAARVLFKGPALVFCTCLFIAHLGNSAYYAFYPLYLTDTVGFEDKWVGPITMLGVVLELGVMACVGLLTAKLGLKRVLVIGLAIMSLRFALLGTWTQQHVAVWTQAMHGITVVAIYVVPPIYLNALAGDHFRSSIQGLYAMTVFGPSRIAGNILGGELSGLSLPMMFNVIAATTLLAVIGLAIWMRPPEKITDQPRDVPPMVEGD